MSEDFETRRKRMLLQAIGSLRGVLYGVRGGQFDLEEVDRILHLTSLASMAQRLGVEEEDLVVEGESFFPHDERNEW